MAAAFSRVPAERVARAFLAAYVVALMGLGFAVEPFVTLVTGGGSVLELSRLLFGCCVFGGAVVMSKNPDELRRGRDPAPASLWVLAGVSTVGAAVVALAAVG